MSEVGTHPDPTIPVVANWLEAELVALCAKMSETSRPWTITVGRGKKSHFDKQKQDKHFVLSAGSSPASSGFRSDRQTASAALYRRVQAFDHRPSQCGSGSWGSGYLVAPRGPLRLALDDLEEAAEVGRDRRPHGQEARPQSGC